MAERKEAHLNTDSLLSRSVALWGIRPKNYQPNPIRRKRTR